MKSKLLPFLVSGLFLFAGACDRKSCTEIAAPTGPESRLPGPYTFVPESARGLIQARKVSALLGLSDAIVSNLPPKAPLAITRREWSDTLGFDPFDPRGWEAWGIDADAPLTLFHDGDRWVAHFPLASPESFEKWFGTYAKEGGALAGETSTVAGGKLWKLSLPPERGSAPLAYVLHARERLLVVPVGRLQPRPWVESATPLPADGAIRSRLESWISMPSRDAWWTNPGMKRLHELVMKKHILSGVLKPGEWLGEVQAHGHAQVLLRRMAEQVGPTGFGIDVDLLDGRVDVEFHGLSDPGEPAFVRDLTGARGELPAVGGLVNPGVLAVVRVSVDPRKFVELLRSTLPAEKRSEFDATLQRLDRELVLDLEKTLLETLDGHAVVAVYGFDNELLGGKSEEILAGLFRLEATREAVLVPVADVEPVKRALDVWTTLSEARLNRQSIGKLTQYAWIEEGELKWAVIVSKNHLLVVDSSAAFEHAMIYERSPRPLATSLSKKNVGQLFEGTDRSGMFVDARSLSNILAETGNSAASWLRPFRWFLVVTEMKNDTSVTRLELKLAEAAEKRDAPGSDVPEAEKKPGEIFAPIDPAQPRSQ